MKAGEKNRPAPARPLRDPEAEDDALRELTMLLKVIPALATAMKDVDALAAAPAQPELAQPAPSDGSPIKPALGKQPFFAFSVVLSITGT